MSSVLRALGITFSLVAILFGALSIVGSLARDSTSVQAEYAGIRVVDVDVAAESVEVVAGVGGSTDVRLERTVSWSWSKPAFSQRQEGDRLVVRSTCPFSFGRGCGGNVRLVVPAATEVRVASAAGSVRVDGLAGVVVLDSSAGSVRGTGLQSADVTATSSAGSVTLIFATPPGQVTADSSAGSVEVWLPPGSESYRVDASSSAGSTEVTVPTDPSSTRRITATSSAGSVRVGVSG